MESNLQCTVRFYYNLMTDQSGVLNVYTRTAWDSNAENGLNQIWSSDGYKFGDFWQSGVVVLYAAQEFQGL